MGSDFTYEVLEFFDNEDAQEDLRWHTKDGKVTFWVMCSDIFAWGCADGEDITPENFPMLKQAFVDVKAIDKFETFWAPILFCARVRGIRPQGAAYPSNKALWPLFDACGQEREVGFDNPYKPGDYNNGM